MFFSLRAGVGELIADIFGSSDEEDDEEFEVLSLCPLFFLFFCFLFVFSSDDLPVKGTLQTPTRRYRVALSQSIGLTIFLSVSFRVSERLSWDSLLKRSEQVR